MDQKDFFADCGEANRYTIKEVIGKGSYGVVCSAVDNFTGEKVRTPRAASHLVEQPGSVAAAWLGPGVMLHRAGGMQGWRAAWLSSGIAWSGCQLAGSPAV